MSDKTQAEVDVRQPPRGGWWKTKLTLLAVSTLGWYHLDMARLVQSSRQPSTVDWGSFPRKDDAFHFLPCTNATVPPSVDDAHALETWTRLYDANRSNWSWGTSLPNALYLCGWLDVALDYTNASDARVARLAVTKLQMAPVKSERTLVVEPGGPGSSGMALVWRSGEDYSRVYTDGTFDVLGWDPRGVSGSQPSIWCFPYDADRDRWSLLTSRFYRDAQPNKTMSTADAMNQAIFGACKLKYGDIATMLTTAFVARDLEQIRKALGESELSGYFLSYGAGIAQTYANMFPSSVGRMVWDGTEDVRDARKLGGFGWAALDNVTVAFHDGFIGECIAAGPDNCTLAQPLTDADPPPTKTQLIQSIDKLFTQLVERPIPGHTNASGPVMITYSQVIPLIYFALYNPMSWDSLATALYLLLQGDASLMSLYIDAWDYNPAQPRHLAVRHSSAELPYLVVCSDQYDAQLPSNYDRATNGERFYLELWKQMVDKTEIGGNSRFLDILPCRHWNSTFGPPKQVYRGGLANRLSTPVLLISQQFDPATPLGNARRLAQDMGDNARLVVVHGYGHTTRGSSRCTNQIMREYLLHGTLPNPPETQCDPDEKPYRYTNGSNTTELRVKRWNEHVDEMRMHSHAPRATW